MPKRKTDDTPNGCFAWLVRVKRAVNERWAKARNSFRRKFAEDNKNGQRLTAEDLVNETGRPDLLISKVPISPRTDITPQEEVTEDACNASFPTPGNVTNQEGDISLKSVSSVSDNSLIVNQTAVGEHDNHEDIPIDTVKERLTNAMETMAVIPDTSSTSLNSAALSDLAVATVRESMRNVIEDMQREAHAVNYDTASMSSEDISVYANAVATLNTLEAESDNNQSASKPSAIPRTVSEVLERLHIDPSIGLEAPAENELPPCLP